MQRERQEELNREENFSKSENRQQSDHKGKGPSADVNMVFMLPMKFLAPFSDDKMEFPDQIAPLALDPMTAMFEKPSDDERQHLKALFVLMQKWICKHKGLIPDSTLRCASRFDLTTDKGDSSNTLVPTTAMRLDATAKRYSRGT